MIRPVFKYPEDKEILTHESYEVTEFNDEIKQIVEDLKDTLLHSNGVGISAIQIGKPYQICIINWAGMHVLINPKITRARGLHTMKEGCLSVPGLYVDNTRAQKIWVSAQDENGNPIQIADGGNTSYIIQHEMDHFKGKCSLFDAYDKLMNGKSENSNVNE